MLLDGKTTTLLRKKLVRLFSPRKPRFLLTGDNALLLTAFALAFSPVCPLSENDGKTTGNRLRLTRFLPVNLVFVAAFAALKVSFPGACPGKDDFYFDEEITFACSQSSRSYFLFVQLFRFQGAFSRSENEFIIKKCAALLCQK